MKLTITLTRAEKAAAKRVVRLEDWERTHRGMCPYRFEDWLSGKIDQDRQLLASAVLRAMKGGAK